MQLDGPAYCRAPAFKAFVAALPESESPAGLFRAAWAIAQHELPEADLAEGEAFLAQLADTVGRRVRSRSPDALLAHLHDLMFDLLGFRGNHEDYYNPANSYLPEVLRTRHGLPIALTLVYRSVGAELGMRVHGVNAPGHFLAEVELAGQHGPRSFYVDPFYSGRLLTEAEAYERIAEATGRATSRTAACLARATSRQWLARMLHNLQAVFASTGRERDLYAMQELETAL